MALVKTKAIIFISCSFWVDAMDLLRRQFCLFL